MDEDEAYTGFWERAKEHLRFNAAPGYFGVTPLESVRPPTWSFGCTPEQADALLELVLAGTKTATSTALWDFEAEDEPVPEKGTLGIVLDGAGLPRALLLTTGIRIVPFAEVDEEHAYAEGEGDRSLGHWREVHERFFREFAAHDRGFGRDMPVVCERFEVLYQE